MHNFLPCVSHIPNLLGIEKVLIIQGARVVACSGVLGEARSGMKYSQGVLLRSPYTKRERLSAAWGVIRTISRAGGRRGCAGAYLFDMCVCVHVRACVCVYICL